MRLSFLLWLWLGISFSVTGQNSRTSLRFDNQVIWCHGDSTSTYVRLTNRTDKVIDKAYMISFADTSLHYHVMDERLVKVQAGKHNLWVNDNPQAIKNTYPKPIDTINFEPGCFYNIYVLDTIDSNFPYFVGQKYVLPIYFDLDADSLRYQSTIVLDFFIKSMEKNTRIRVHIGVHFDERCSPMLSNCLSCRYADFLSNYFKSNHLTEERIQVKGYQGTRPIFIGAKTEKQHQWNRRVEVTVIGF